MRMAPLALACLLAVAPTTAAFAAKPSNLYVFGDSLVDAGNLDAAVGNDSFNPASAGYFPGRFTNGPDYTDLLYKSFFGTYSAPSLLGGTNYAFADARAVDLGGAVPAVGAQVASYLADHGGVADGSALFVINIGGNDVFGLEDNDIGGYTPDAYAQAVVTSILGAVGALDAAGARNFLVAGIPVIDPVGAALDASLQDGLDAFSHGLPGHIARLDYQSLLPAIVGDPGAFGLPPFTNFTDACIDNEPVIGGRIDCTGYVYFDDTHPTAAIQSAVFGAVRAAVPEPAAWALLVVGFGVAGRGLRARRRAQA